MSAINRVSPIASSTAPNWLKEAQESLAAAENSAGMMGALQNSTSNTGSVRSFLANSQQAAGALASIGMNNDSAVRDLVLQEAAKAAQQRAFDRAALQVKIAPTNPDPPKQLDPMIYFSNGSTLDTVRNVLTMSDGKQIDTITGHDYVDETAIIRMANGAYLNTKDNILVMADGTKLDAVTGIKITV